MNPVSERLEKVIRSCATMEHLIVAWNMFQLALKHLSAIEQAQTWVVLKDQSAVIRRKGIHIVGGDAC